MYTKKPEYFCRIDLHARTMYLCVLGRNGEVFLHKGLPAKGAAFLATVKPYRSDLMVGVECIFCWYWIADLCKKEGIEFVLGHTYSM